MRGKPVVGLQHELVDIQLPLLLEVVLVLMPLPGEFPVCFVHVPPRDFGTEPEHDVRRAVPWHSQGFPSFGRKAAQLPRHGGRSREEGRLEGPLEGSGPGTERLARNDCEMNIYRVPLFDTVILIATGIAIIIAICLDIAASDSAIVGERDRASVIMIMKIDASATRASASDNVNANDSDSASATVRRIPYYWPDKLSAGWGNHFGYQYVAFHIGGRISFRLAGATISGTSTAFDISCRISFLLAGVTILGTSTSHSISVAG